MNEWMNEWMNEYGIWTDSDSWKPKYSVRNLPGATLSTKNPIWTGPGLHIESSLGLSWPTGMCLAFHIASALCVKDLDWEH